MDVQTVLRCLHSGGGRTWSQDALLQGQFSLSHCTTFCFWNHWSVDGDWGVRGSVLKLHWEIRRKGEHYRRYLWFWALEKQALGLLVPLAAFITVVTAQPVNSCGWVSPTSHVSALPTQRKRFIVDYFVLVQMMKIYTALLDEEIRFCSVRYHDLMNKDLFGFMKWFFPFRNSFFYEDPLWSLLPMETLVSVLS